MKYIVYCYMFYCDIDFMKNQIFHAKNFCCVCISYKKELAQ